MGIFDVGREVVAYDICQNLKKGFVSEICPSFNTFNFFFLAGVYDDLQPTELNVKSGDCFLPEQKSTVLIKETETPKGDEANVKKTVKGVDNLTFCCNCSNLYFNYYVRYH